MLLTCTSCNNDESYKIENYLYKLAIDSGISTDDKTYFNDLLNWKIVDDKDMDILKENLNYQYLNKTIGRLLKDNDGDCLTKYKLISILKNKNSSINKSTAEEVIKKAVDIINNRQYEDEYKYIEKENIIHEDEYYIKDNKIYTDNKYSVGDIVYLSDNGYKKIIGYEKDGYIFKDAEIDEVFSDLKLSGSPELNLEDCIVEEYGDKYETSYKNNNFNLLSSKSNSFSVAGFKVSYSIKSSGIDFRINKDTSKGLNAYFDVSLSNIKPTYNWDYEDGKLKNAFFKIDYKLTNSIGVSTGKRENLKLNLKDVDTSSIASIIKSAVKKSSDEVEATIPICEVKLPIPNVPTLYINLDVVIRIYVSGRIEIVVYNTSQHGFEIDDGNFRLINNVDRDIDMIIGANAKAVVGLNFSVELLTIRLMDIELDGGLQASIKTTVHIYDSDGNKYEIELDAPYSDSDEIAKENEEVRVCGDISFNWVLDLQFNTSKTLLSKIGLSKKIEILNEKDQVLGNKTHIENWQFLDHCTRKDRKVLNTNSEEIDTNKISLDKYSLVIKVGTNKEVPIKALPKGYTTDDLVYASSDANIMNYENGVIVAKTLGSAVLEIKTKDNKYQAYINILVSTG